MKRIIEKNFNEHIKVTNKTMKKLKNKISSISLEIKDCLNRNGKIIWCGNGGSAADSLHLSSEFLGKFKNKRKPLASISLSSDISNITCISNDFGYENVFSRQLEGIGNRQDILFAISTSGKSKNILKAIKSANNKKIKVIFLNSIQNKKKNKTINIDIKVPAKRVDRIQELHIFVGHLICEIIEKKIG